MRQALPIIALQMDVGAMLMRRKLLGAPYKDCCVALLDNSDLFPTVSKGVNPQFLIEADGGCDKVLNKCTSSSWSGFYKLEDLKEDATKNNLTCDVDDIYPKAVTICRSGDRAGSRLTGSSPKMTDEGVSKLTNKGKKCQEAAVAAADAVSGSDECKTFLTECKANGDDKMYWQFDIVQSGVVMSRPVPNFDALHGQCATLEDSAGVAAVGSVLPPPTTGKNNIDAEEPPKVSTPSVEAATVVKSGEAANVAKADEAARVANAADAAAMAANAAAEAAKAEVVTHPDDKTKLDAANRLQQVATDATEAAKQAKVASGLASAAAFGEAIVPTTPSVPTAKAPAARRASTGPTVTAEEGCSGSDEKQATHK